MRAVVRDIEFEPDPRTLPAEPADFTFLATMTVGPSGGRGGDLFSVTVCTSESLAKRCQAEGYVDGRHIVVTSFDTYSESDLRSFLKRRVEQVTG